MKSDTLIINKIIEDYSSVLANLETIGLDISHLDRMYNNAKSAGKVLNANDFIDLRDIGVERFKKLNLAIKEYEDVYSVDPEDERFIYDEETKVVKGQTQTASNTDEISNEDSYISADELKNTIELSGQKYDS